MIALDASALLAILFKEPGQERVAEVIDSACISTVNFSEVLSRFTRMGEVRSSMLDTLDAMPIERVPFSEAQAILAAELLPGTRALGLSLGDRACLALAIERGIPAMTADRIWAHLGPEIRVELIR